MIPTNAPRAALFACIDALTPPNNAEDTAAVVLAEKALRTLPYTAASLETAACLWEFVLEAINDTNSAYGGLIRATVSEMGTSHLRLTVIGWTDAVDADWRHTDTYGGDFDRGGQYSAAFDWEFVPAWVVDRVDWSNPNAPTLRDGILETLARGFTRTTDGTYCKGVGAGGYAMVIAHGAGGADAPTLEHWQVNAHFGDDEAPGWSTNSEGDMRFADAVAEAEKRCGAYLEELASHLPVEPAPVNPVPEDAPTITAATSFYVAVVVDAHGVEWSDVVWSDYDIATIEAQAVEDATFAGVAVNGGAVTIHGPFTVGDAVNRH